ncbi:MAG: hypothetical protein FIA99_12325 [Ruminiclostridium sp.]|nr:hypothetical protein [Ruminiclostridium sp.]
MIIYIIVVFGIVIITSTLLMYILNKIKMLNYRMILALSLSSVIAGLSFPGIVNFVSIGKGVMVDVPQLVFVLVATSVLYIMLVFIISVIISVVIPDSTFSAIASGFIKERVNRVNNETQTPVTEKIESAGNENIRQVRNYLEEIYGNKVVETVNIGTNIEDNTQQPENNLEKSVDSVENIDKMRLETFEQDNSSHLSLEDCVDEAFRLKEQGDCEGAILYFMYALDRKPGKDLTFWIVLDICVLYKSIGQVGFARNMLSTYFDTYSDFMDDRVREEIESNLSYMDE